MVDSAHLKALILKKIIKALRDKNALPQNIDISDLGGIFISSIYNTLLSEVITESVQTGVASDPNLAVIKGLVEYVERRSFSNGHFHRLKSCLTERTDGLAAYPYFFHSEEKVRMMARKNSFYECIERFSWANWWDDLNIKHELKHWDSQNSYDQPSKNLYKLIEKNTPLKRILLIFPKLTFLKNKSPISEEGECIIIFGQLMDGGYISGGAAGSVRDHQQTVFRALSEMYRHSLALKRIKEENIPATTFYEKRLRFFGLGEGDELVKERIIQKGNKVLEVPKLEIDEEIPHDLSTSIYVHRCLFNNMPNFIGGNLERFCL